MHVVLPLPCHADVLRAQDGKELAEWLKELRVFINAHAAPQTLSDQPYGAGAAQTPAALLATPSKARFKRAGTLHGKLLQGVAAEADAVGAAFDASAASKRAGSGKPDGIADRLGSALSRGRGPDHLAEGSARAVSVAPLQRTADGALDTLGGGLAGGGANGEGGVVAGGRGAARSGIGAAVPPSPRVPFGVLSKTSRRGKEQTRFFMVRDSVLLYALT
jgi:hypothetical protein